MAEKVHRLGLKREYGYTYYVDREGDVCKAELNWHKRKREKEAV